VYYNTITAMPAYANKSVEELRWEDYQAGVKNASAAPAPTGGGFGAPASQPAFGGFGASPAPAFGASAPAANPFGAPAPASPFGGGFGATSSECGFIDWWLCCFCCLHVHE
jgi:nuclear pore complex protein Nup98-Nup96